MEPFPIPSSFGIPTCTSCGEEPISLVVSEKLDALIFEESPQAQIKYFRNHHSEAEFYEILIAEIGKVIECFCDPLPGSCEFTIIHTTMED